MIKNILNRFKIAFLMVFILILAFIALIEPNSYYRQINGSLLQALIVFIMIATVLTAKEQIDELKKVEEKKRIMAIQSLIFEIKINQTILTNYVNNFRKGGHGKHSADSPGCPTYDLLTPHFVNYEQFFTLACYDNEELAIKIIEIYLVLAGCRSLINQNLNFISNNSVLKDNSRLAALSFENNVIKHNKLICEESEKQIKSFDGIIKELEVLRDSVKCR